MPDPDLHAAARVVFETTDTGQSIQLTFLVPVGLLWSGAGLAELFDTCRLAWCGPEPPDTASLADHNRWEDWHLISISEDEGDPQIVLADWKKLM
jgi:hypothetical protein